MTQIYWILNKSLKKAIQIHKDEIKRIRANDASDYIGQLTVVQENKIQKLESELARKQFLEDKKDKHSKRMYRYNEKLKDAGQELISLLESKTSSSQNDNTLNEAIAKLSKLVSNVGGEAAATIEEN